MAAPLDLVAAKKNLSDALGDGMKLYLQILRQWFKAKLSREDFDHEARKLMSPETVKFHNQFLLCIIAKCHGSGSALVRESSSSHSSSSSQSKLVKKSKSRKRLHHHYSSSSSKTNFNQRFLPAEPLAIAPHIQDHHPQPEERGPGYVCREFVLPDLGMVQGRFLVTAWDYGLDDVHDDAAKLVMQAVEHQLKSVITAILSRRNGYKLRDGRFKHAMGIQVPPPILRNTISAKNSTTNNSDATSVSVRGVHMPHVRPSVDTADRDAAVHLSLSQHVQKNRAPISLFDCMEALQCNKSVIPSHTVYASCMEHIVHRLWHPSREEQEAAALRQHKGVSSPTSSLSSTTLTDSALGARLLAKS